VEGSTTEKLLAQILVALERMEKTLMGSVISFCLAEVLAPGTEFLMSRLFGITTQKLFWTSYIELR
jgi:hypothetical protein